MKMQCKRPLPVLWTVTRLPLMWKTLASFPQSLGKPCADSGFPTAAWITASRLPTLTTARLLLELFFTGCLDRIGGL